MAVNSLVGPSPIPSPKRPEHQVGALASRKPGQPVDSSMLANPVFYLNVVWMSILGESRSFSLLGSEKTLLPFYCLVEPLGGFSVFVSRNTILQLI
jgi:hypothetical protein